MKLTREVRHIKTDAGKMKIVILRPENTGKIPGILWIHGGGYMTGNSEMVYFSVGRMLARKYGAVVVSPAYRLGWKAPYPAALDDCYAALGYLCGHAEELGVDRNRIIVGGESAGGGLCAALAIYARDRGEIPLALQFPLYPMIDCRDTESSAKNHGLVWGTRRNHWGWRGYLGELYGSDSVPKYASPSLETDYSGLPPCYTFVQSGEPFRSETETYVGKLNEAGVEASMDIYNGKTHAFDMLLFTRKSRKARAKVCDAYEHFMREG